MQGGGVERFKATDYTPAVMPDWANRAGESHARVTRLEPSERTRRLLTTLLVGVKPGQDASRGLG
jgi:hypothetical protein